MNTLRIGNHNLGIRDIATEDGIMQVPSYVYRVPYGWVVKINRHDEKHHRTFNDSLYGGIRSALSMAIEHLYDELPNRRTFDQMRPGSSLWYLVRERLHKKDGRVVYQFVQTYVCGYHGKLRTVGFYVGTPNTRSDLKLRLAIDQAIGTRCWSIDTIKQEGRSHLYESPIPKNVEQYAY